MTFHKIEPFKKWAEAYYEQSHSSYPTLDEFIESGVSFINAIGYYSLADMGIPPPFPNRSCDEF